ncbi:MULTISPECIES: biosynthetic peptidoglycan transglycosylase [Enterobacter]|uniref:biosynthetic peptidoglycan transglycosylase n=1 Tax=Enterobacter TaxID=547 RepID=UPI0032AFA03E
MALNQEWLQLKRQTEYLRREVNNLKISSNLEVMLIAGEDRRFNRHHGVDFFSIFRAFWRTFFCRKREGASTIAMQLVRVLRGRYEKTLSRKLSEMYLAIRLTKNTKKDDIPKLYLFVAYYGWRMNGLVQVSNRLKLDLANLNDHEAASIIARLKYPEPKNYNQLRHDKIMLRAGYILDRVDSLKNIYS